MPTKDIKEPKDIVIAYYHSLYTGDLTQVKKIMTWESYAMTLESFGLKLALKDPVFKSQLKEIETPEILKQVEIKLSKELASRQKIPQIEIISIESNGSKRQTAHFKEDGKDKVLYFAKEDEDWKINYYAGRKVNEVN
ncbi:hypothetical protein PGH07_01785 [Sulfurovum sp. zt1-1]|uniref:DUF4878 domain-containing protein n=1 Tax=Sulfurovum zhangzhouensis TaxID=3019067 RepID=A0ABT7QVN9_9BACT|nr:hypothetical protein [Sulfurovum zhangzhouensis]MDM5270904.1 hypothetical protein [Sulfurovum zhangzhouensis]